jgi:hypothetical protein
MAQFEETFLVINGPKGDSFVLCHRCDILLLAHFSQLKSLKCKLLLLLTPIYRTLLLLLLLMTAQNKSN